VTLKYRKIKIAPTTIPEGNDTARSSHHALERHPTLHQNGSSVPWQKERRLPEEGTMTLASRAKTNPRQNTRSHEENQGRKTPPIADRTIWIERQTVRR
jgi:hypothetical protein